MSLRRQDLVPASEKMSTDLEKIQQDSQRHNEHIEKTLEEVKQEQEAAKALLQSDCLTKGLMKTMNDKMHNAIQF